MVVVVVMRLHSVATVRHRSGQTAPFAGLRHERAACNGLLCEVLRPRRAENSTTAVEVVLCGMPLVRAQFDATLKKVMHRLSRYAVLPRNIGETQAALIERDRFHNVGLTELFQAARHVAHSFFDEPNCGELSHVVVAGNAGPVAPEDPPGVVVDLAEGDGAHSGALESEREAADAAEQVEDIHADLAAL